MKPEITLPDYDGLEAQVEDIEVTDEDVEEQVQALRERFASLIDVERAAADGDFVVLDLKATQDGEVVEGAEVTGMSYQVGRGGMLDGLDEALDRHGRRRGEDLHLPARRRRPRGRRTSRSRSRSRRSRSRSCPSSTTTSPRWRPSSTPSRS